MFIKLKRMCSQFWNDEDGDICVVMAVLFPVILWLTLFFENEMQARYVYTQTQTVLDLATKAGATTGEAVQTDSSVFCTIPLNPSNPEYSGYHVAIKVLEENLDTLPEQVQEQIQLQIDTKQIEDLDNTDLRATGYVEMKMSFVYDSTTPFFNNYRFHLSSSARCQAVRSNRSQGSGSWNGEVLNASNGTVEGPSGKETYYNLDMTGVLQIMRNAGNQDPYWVRADGVKMLGDYVMVAADLSVHPRGSLVETSLGTGIVCDTGTFIYSNSNQLDIAVTW